MNKIRLMMFGGFLGAGKTTSIARLAKECQQQGKRVAIITNDHASELVDTHRLRSEGLLVGEMPGGCFCGSVDVFLDALQQVSVDERPDMVFIEPIGSCIDLTATVIRPLLQHLGDQIEIAPYCVILKPSHGLKILKRQAKSGFSPQAEYIFLKQLEEADCLVLNRIDQLTDGEADELEDLLQSHCPSVPVLRASATTGQGFDVIQEVLNQQGRFGQRRVDVDYGQYAAGEAALAWLNGTFRVKASVPFNVDDLLLDCLMLLKAAFSEFEAETAHVKVIGLGQDSCGAANLVASDSPVEVTLKAKHATTSMRLIVNARVAIEPAKLSDCLNRALNELANRYGIAIGDRFVQCFQPGQPTVQLVPLSLG